MRALGALRGSSEGMALVLTLAVLTLITAMVVEFAHGVYVYMGFLDNWRTSTQMSLLSKSGVEIASKYLVENLKGKSYTYPGVIRVPSVSPFGAEGSGGVVSIVIEDENSKFNLNSMLYGKGTINEQAYESFKRLVLELGLDADIAPRVADWLDRDNLPRLSGSDKGLKNASLESTDELLQIPGISRSAYDRLAPYVTVYGNGMININGAAAPVLMALDDSLTGEMAERIISYRQLNPFESEGQLTSVAGFENLGISLMGRITVKGELFSIESTATSADGIKRTVHCVLATSGNKVYWKES